MSNRSINSSSVLCKCQNGPRKSLGQGKYAKFNINVNSYRLPYSVLGFKLHQNI